MEYELFQPTGIEQFVLGGDKEGFHARQGFDQFHSFVDTKDKTGGAEGIPVYGVVGKNGHAGKPRIRRISGSRVQ